MILTCPQCATRYQADAAKFPAAGRSVRCAKCGNVWHQIGPEQEPDPNAEIFVQEPEAAPAAAPQPAPVAAPAPVAPPEPIAAPSRVAAFAPTITRDPEDDVEADAPPAPRRATGALGGRVAILGGWVALVALVLVIGWAAVNFRDSIATWVPQTSSIYSAAGLPVNPRGIDFTDVTFQKQLEDGQQVLAVTGKILNRSNHELTVPLVRVALFDADRHELYHWTFVPGVSTLQPGQFAKFRTRLSSPPAGTKNLEIRFARAGE